jgi:hypothetical protein
MLSPDRREPALLKQAPWRHEPGIEHIPERHYTMQALGKNTFRVGLRRLLCIGTLLAATLANAAGTTDEADGLRKVGEARLKVMFWSVYDSRLFTTDGAYRPGTRPLRLEIEYLLDISAQNLIKRTAQEWQAMGRQQPAQGQWLEQLAALWPDVRKGDVLTLEIAENERATFYHNGQRLGTMDDADFGQQFIDIWLSPESTRPELRLALIGGDS